jgi:hypothetical protein
MPQTSSTSRSRRLGTSKYRALLAADYRPGVHLHVSPQEPGGRGAAEEPLRIFYVVGLQAAVGVELRLE